jgi:hypothetical protein
MIFVKKNVEPVAQRVPGERNVHRKSPQVSMLLP